jgi:O-antigen/teichoic acid export membrane protein
LQSVWALVIGGLCGSRFKVASVASRAAGARARIVHSSERLLELFHFGKWIFLSTIAGFLLKHGDRAILGKYIDAERTGLLQHRLHAHTLKTTRLSCFTAPSISPYRA